MSVLYLVFVLLGKLASSLIFLTRKDDFQAGYDILSILPATVCASAATAFFFLGRELSC